MHSLKIQPLSELREPLHFHLTTKMEYCIVNFLAIIIVYILYPHIFIDLFFYSTYCTQILFVCPFPCAAPWLYQDPYAKTYQIFATMACESLVCLFALVTWPVSFQIHFQAAVKQNHNIDSCSTIDKISISTHKVWVCVMAFSHLLLGNEPEN